LTVFNTKINVDGVNLFDVFPVKVNVAFVFYMSIFDMYLI